MQHLRQCPQVVQLWHNIKQLRTVGTAAETDAEVYPLTAGLSHMCNIKILYVLLETAQGPSVMLTLPAMAQQRLYV